jgi:hypothetical protein
MFGEAVSKWVDKRTLELVKKGGIKVSDEEYERRLQICKGCDKRGMVKPLKNIPEMEGCTECGCPFETKLKFKYHFLTNVEKITCPHPGGAKW